MTQLSRGNAAQADAQAQKARSAPENAFVSARKNHKTPPSSACQRIHLYYRKLRLIAMDFSIFAVFTKNPDGPPENLSHP